MCPICIAAAALIAGKVTLAGGLAAIGIKKLGVKNVVDRNSATAPSNLPGADNGTEEIGPDANQRRD